MRVLYICRAFLGLESTWRDGQWEPAGVPTVYKVIEALDTQAEELRLIFTVRGEEESMKDQSCSSFREIKVDGLRSRILVSYGPFHFPRFLRNLQMVLVEVMHIVRVLREVFKMRPDLVYVDRGNLIPGAFAARFTKVPVLLRLMGIPPPMWDIFNSRHPWLLVMRWAFRSPFAQVLCTQDGTPGEAFMNTALRPGVPRQMMLNGVDMQRDRVVPNPQIARIPHDKFVVLFVGRLVALKGPETFVEAVLRLVPAHTDRIHALMIGTGELEEQLRARVAEIGAENMITFVSSVPHRQIGLIYRLADVYVSLNRMGNLSNANLECMHNGLCMIVPPSRPEEGTDVDLDRLMPQDTIIRLSPNTDEVSQLASLIDELSRNPVQVQERKRRTAAVAAVTLKFWEERIAAEMNMLKKLIDTPVSRNCSIS